MDLYQEFGLSPSATPDQIKQAHRGLARLLHPDNFQDSELRRLAECQMKRVNSIYSVLSDPERRQKYNQQAYPLVKPLPWRLIRRNLLWLVATAASVTTIYWLLSAHAVHPPAEPAPDTTAAPPPVPPKPAPVSSAPLRSRPPAQDHEEVRQLVRENKELRRLLEQALAERDHALERLAAIPSVLPPAPVAITPQAPQPSSPGLAGTWLYLPSSREPIPGHLYPPEYIELVIGEQSGTVLGRYRARYRVTDRAISPEVQFQFEGKSGDSNRFSWTGNAGARGEVQLKLLSDDTLSVDWFTSHFGRQAALTSGNAVLVRRHEP